MDNDINDDGSMKTKRRGRKPKDKFKYETADIDEYARHNKKDDNVIIKLPLSCIKLNEEFNIGKDLFPYNPKLSVPKPYNPEPERKADMNYSGYTPSGEKVADFKEPTDKPTNSKPDPKNMTVDEVLKNNIEVPPEYKTIIDRVKSIKAKFKA
jgi:hypothetical protein